MIKRTLVIALTNQKGGCGKTLSASAFAGILSRQGYLVLLIDLDAQGHLSRTYLRDIPVETIADTFNDGIFPIVTLTDTLSIIPCNTDISMISKALSEPSDRLILKNAFKKLNGKYDYIIMDCPPSFDFITINAITAADYVFVPAQTTKSCVDAISLLAEECYLAANDARINGIFFVNYDSRPKINRKMENVIRSKYGSIVFNTPIRHCIKVDEAKDAMKDVAEYDPSCNAAKDYIALVDEILTMVNNTQES